MPARYCKTSVLVVKIEKWQDCYDDYVDLGNHESGPYACDDYDYDGWRLLRRDDDGSRK